MIVYGDHHRVEDPRELLRSLESHCGPSEGAAIEGPESEAATGRLVATGELAQGLLDAAFEARGYDEWGDLEEACALLTVAAARTPFDRAEFRRALSRLARCELPGAVTIRVPEGFAFYALAPWLYTGAAKQLAASVPAAHAVIGIRSIGVSLAAAVAVAVGSGTLPVTLRPVGHPFRRAVKVGPALRARLLGLSSETPVAIVDEGPGLSGSSFGAVADWLEEIGIGRDRIHFLPGHAGELGPEASPRHRERWDRSARHVVDFEEDRRRRFPGASLFEDDPSASRCAVRELSGGAWRAGRFALTAEWPPAHRYQERRKYLYTLHGEPRLAKFAGFGRYGEAKLARAGRLAGAGWVPPPLGLRHGFLVERWLEDARPGLPSDRSDRADLLDAVAGYLGFRARAFPVPQRAGASARDLLEMLRVNVPERFGDDWDDALVTWEPLLASLAERTRRVVTDNRMHAWEWLRTADGRWRKADALDHAEAHDLIGAQDLAWDVAGAVVELGLDGDELDTLETRLARTADYRPDPIVLRFHLLAYLAFQMGSYEMARAAHASDPEESSRLAAAAERYAGRLSAMHRAGHFQPS